nr:MAG TPA: hypothetical protein [Caudoviricetes sp.]
MIYIMIYNYFLLTNSNRFIPLFFTFPFNFLT